MSSSDLENAKRCRLLFLKCMTVTRRYSGGSYDIIAGISRKLSLNTDETIRINDLSLLNKKTEQEECCLLKMTYSSENFPLRLISNMKE